MTIRITKNQLLLAAGLFLFSLTGFATTDSSEKENKAKKENNVPVSYEISDVLKELNRVSFTGAEMTLKNRVEKFPETSLTVKNYLTELKRFEEQWEQLVSQVEQKDKTVVAKAKAFLQNHRAALLQNPLLMDKEIYAVRQIVENSRAAMAREIGRNQNNWTTNATIERTGWNNEICKLSGLTGDVQLSTIYKT